MGVLVVKTTKDRHLKTSGSRNDNEIYVCLESNHNLDHLEIFVKPKNLNPNDLFNSHEIREQEEKISVCM